MLQTLQTPACSMQYTCHIITILKHKCKKKIMDLKQKQEEEEGKKAK
jgi:hypothetical protein